MSYMKLNIIEQGKNELRVELVGEGHSLCNALHGALLRDETVDFAGYDISHPFISHPVIYIRTKGRRDPMNALLDAASNLGKELGEFGRAFLEAWEDERRRTSEGGKT